MNSVYELSDDELSDVTGGNYGDMQEFSNKNSVIYNYNEGQTVQVFKSGVHLKSNTKTGTILTRYAGYKNGKYHAMYIVKFAEMDVVDVSEVDICH